MDSSINKLKEQVIYKKLFLEKTTGNIGLIADGSVGKESQQPKRKASHNS